MKCPNDQTTLVISERSGIEIDYCPECRGVWLDRGELDKIIDRQSVSMPTEQKYKTVYADDQTAHHHQDKHYKKNRRESFLGDLFDF